MSPVDAVARLFAVAIIAIGFIGFWVWVKRALAGSLRWMRQTVERLELWLSRPSLPDTQSALPPLGAQRADVPVLMLLPLWTQGDGEREARELTAIGLALSRLAIRRLMLRADLSVRGPEDTPAVGVASREHVPAAVRAAQHVFGGSLTRGGRDYVVKAWLISPDGTVHEAQLSAGALPDLLGQLAATAALWLGSTHAGEQPHRPVLQATTPSGEAGFIALGAALLDVGRSRDELEADEILLTALDRGPELSLLASQLSGYHLRAKLRALEAAPCDAQLCYSIALDVWRGPFEEGAARTYLLKALELAPCHARANAIAYRVARDPKLHGQRAALGYMLAPGSAFAAHHYALYLMRHGGSDAETLRVASRLVAIEPSDPVGLWAMMTAYERTGDRSRAIEAAERLLRWLQPLDPRAGRQLRADRDFSERMDEGWSLASDVTKQLEALKAEPSAAARPQSGR